MNSKIRKLAFDFNPSAGVFALFYFLVVAVTDFDWVNTYPHVRPTTFGGLLMGVASNLMVSKRPMWRFLPVSRAEIGKACWWQAVGAPVAALIALMATVALIEMARQHSLPPLTVIATAVASQCGFVVVIALMQNFIGPSVAGGKRWFKALALFGNLALILFLNSSAYSRSNSATIVPALSLLALVGAPALYLMTEKWPQPTANWSWFSASPQRFEEPSEPAGPRGWTAAFMVAWPMLALVWAAAAVQPVLYTFLIPHFVDEKFMNWMIAMMATIASVGFLNPGIRALRILPLTASVLAVVLCAVVIAINSIALFVFEAAFHLLHPTAPLEIGFLLPLIGLPVIFLSMAMRFGPAAVQFGYLSALPLILAIDILNSYVPAQLMALLALAIIVAGCSWTWWEIARGANAYRSRPIAPPRWRGVS